MDRIKINKLYTRAEAIKLIGHTNGIEQNKWPFKGSNNYYNNIKRDVFSHTITMPKEYDEQTTYFHTTTSVNTIHALQG